MKVEELLKQNPKVKEALHKWFFDKLTGSFKNFDKDEAFKDYMLTKGVSEEQIKSMVEHNPRGCFDLLDSHDIIITVKHDVNGWTNSYYPSEDDKTYDSRLACERAGLEIGIAELEKQLTNENG